jgi:hypothetical protein
LLPLFFFTDAPALLFCEPFGFVPTSRKHRQKNKNRKKNDPERAALRALFSSLAPPLSLSPDNLSRKHAHEKHIRAHTQTRVPLAP